MSDFSDRIVYCTGEVDEFECKMTGAEFAERARKSLAPRADTYQYRPSEGDRWRNCSKKSFDMMPNNLRRLVARADAERKYTDEEMERYGKCYADARDKRLKRADAEKDAALESVMAKHMDKNDRGREFSNIACAQFNAVRSLVEELRAILAATKEPK